MTDFVLCVRILIFWKRQKCAVTFDFSRIFQLTFFSDCWLHLLLQGFNLNHFVFSRLFVLRMIDMFVALESCYSKKLSCCFYWQILLFRLIFPLAWFLPSKSQTRRFFFSRSNGLINSQFFCCIGILIYHKCQQNCLWYGLILICELMFLQNNWLHFFFQGLSLEVSTCLGFFRQRSIILFHEVESWWIKNSTTCWYAGHAWIFKLIFPSALPASFFHQGFNRSLFHLSRIICF